MTRKHAVIVMMAAAVMTPLATLLPLRAVDTPPSNSSSEIKSLDDTLAVLKKPCGLPRAVNGSLFDLLSKLGDLHSVNVRLDPAVFSNSSTKALHDAEIVIRNTTSMTVEDVMAVICAELRSHTDSEIPSKLGIIPKKGQLIISHVFLPASIPGEYKTTNTPTLVLPTDMIQGQLYGPMVSISCTDKSVVEIVKMLRETSGANIVLDDRVLDQLQKRVSLSMSNVRLRTVLSVIANLCEVGFASMDNVFILSTFENAESIMTETERNLFGMKNKGE
jgi:hypothetical protein